MNNKEQNLLAVLLGVDNETADCIHQLWIKGWRIQFDGYFNCIGLKRGKRNEKI